MLLRFRLFFVIIVTGITANAAELRIAVSDLIAGYVAETVRARAASDSVELSVISAGSLPAMHALDSDDILLAIVAAPDGGEAPGDAFKTLNFAYSTAVIAVNQANPINKVSFYDLRGIFGLDAEPSMETWETLGINSLSGRSIKPLVTQDDTVISSELFRHVVLQGMPMKFTVNELVYSEIEAMLVNDRTSVAILPYLPDNDGIKALTVSADSGSPAFGPTNDNVYYGDYPLRLPFKIVYKKDREAEVANVLRILLSYEVTEALRANHLFVPPDTIRTGFVNSLDWIE